MLEFSLMERKAGILGLIFSPGRGRRSDQLQNHTILSGTTVTELSDNPLNNVKETTDQASLHVGENHGFIHAYNKSLVVIRTHKEGSVGFADQAVGTVGLGEGITTAHDLSMVYLDTRTTKCLVNCEPSARIITPKGILSSILPPEVAGIRRDYHEYYTLPEVISSLSSLLWIGGKIDQEKVKAAQGTINTEKGRTMVVLTAMNRLGNAMHVTFEVKKIPDVKGRPSSPMLVMIRAEDVHT